MHPFRLLFAFSLCLLLISLAAFVPRSVRAFNYVVNGDFEGGMDGWTASGSAAFDAVDGSLFGGSGSAGRLVLSGGASSARQSSFAGTPAGQYNFSARLRLSSATMIAYAQVSSNPSITTVRFDAPQVSGTWLEVGGTVDVTGFTNVSFTIGASGSPGDELLFDDVRFDGADPATMTPTDTPIPPTSSHTSLPPTGTRTPKPTNTPKPTSTSAAALETPPGDTTAGGDVDGPSTALRNGGFEEIGEGAPQAWDKYGGSLSSATAPVHSGGYAARLESTTESTKWLFQTVQVAPGQAYAFDAWLLHNDPAIAIAFLRISWYESSDGSGTALGTADSTQRLDSPASDWRLLTTAAVAPPPQAQSAKVRVMLQPSSVARAALYVDDASFGETTSPIVSGSSGHPAPVSAAQAAARGERASTGRATSAGSQPVTLADGVTIVINEVLYDSMNNPDGAGEWIELYNPGDRPVSLEGWTIADNRSIDIIDSLTVPTRGFAILAGNGFLKAYPDVDTAVEIVGGTIGNSLGNDGDVIVLLDPAGRFVDAVSWGSDTAALDPAVPDVPEGHSIERRVPGADSDIANDFVDNDTPSPGEAYRAPGAPALGIQPKAGANVEILGADGDPSFAWLPWALAATSMAALAGVASWRLLPSLAQRLRHQ